MKKFNKNSTLDLHIKKINKKNKKKQKSLEIIKSKKIFRDILIFIFILLAACFFVVANLIFMDIILIQNRDFKILLIVSVYLGTAVSFVCIMFLKFAFNTTNKKELYEIKDEEIDIGRKVIRNVLFVLLLLMAPVCFVIASLIVLDIIVIPIQDFRLNRLIIFFAALGAIACLIGSVLVKFLFDTEKRKGRYKKGTRSNRHNKR